jgi:DNA polymerase V
MFALDDINSCYAFYETLFRPELRGKPVVVLSSNDGCVIARPREATRLKIGMGDPCFSIKSAPYPEMVYAPSSNFSLYYSLTERVMRHIEEVAPSCERYSADEVFLMLDGMNRYMNYDAYGQQLREHVNAEQA